MPTFPGSQQEPRLLAEFSQDENMIKAYKEGKDLYATMGSIVYNLPYWECMEHYEDGSPNEEGKNRRKAMKVLLLGISYGMQVDGIASDLGCSVKEAAAILNTFYEKFPKVKKWKLESEAFAHNNGYVEDFWGRRRRLPELQLPKYTMRPIKSSNDFNPLLDTKGIISNVNQELVNNYLEKCKTIKNYRDFYDLKNEAKKQGYYLDDNTVLIQAAERQCVNARIQGSAATMTKKAMIDIYNDPELNDLGFKMMLLVHDEIIGECPEINAQKASERLSYLMRNCVPDVGIPFKCDSVIDKNWYQTEFQNYIAYEHDELKNKGVKEDAILDKLAKIHSELSKEEICSYINK